MTPRPPDPDWPTAADWLRDGRPRPPISWWWACRCRSPPSPSPPVATRPPLPCAGGWRCCPPSAPSATSTSATCAPGCRRPHPATLGQGDRRRRRGGRRRRPPCGAHRRRQLPHLPRPLGLAGEDLESWGLVTLDAHHDVRTYEGRPGNGSPVRALVDAGLPGNQLVQVGIAGFSNSARLPALVRGRRHRRGHRRRGALRHMEDVLVEAFDRLGLSVDHIYVDLDVDVLDSAFAPGLPRRPPRRSHPRRAVRRRLPGRPEPPGPGRRHRRGRRRPGRRLPHGGHRRPLPPQRRRRPARTDPLIRQKVW